MLRIEAIETARGHWILKAEGEVVGPWVAELRRVCERVVGVDINVTLDLAEVAFLDREGVALFRRLADQGVAFLNCSPFVQNQLST